MAEEKTVLCVFQGRSRPITFKSGGNPKEEYENLLEAMLAGFHDLISKTNQATSSASSYHLERESTEWNRLIDVSGYVQEKEVVHLCLSSTKSTVGEVILILSYYN